MKGKARTDAGGRAIVHFTLPEKINTPDGLLNLQIEDKGQTESISRPIPLVLNQIDLQFLPEGGDAVAGLPCLMAFKALNEFGKPADVEGRIETAEGQLVTRFSSFHNGMGAFDFTPAPGVKYVAYLEKPAPLPQAFPLPEALKEGPVLHLEAQNEQYLFFRVGSRRPVSLTLTGCAQDKILFYKNLNINGAAESIAVPIGDWPIGIARFTLLERKENAGSQGTLPPSPDLKNLTECAERLVFLHRDRGLRLELSTEKSQYLPREKVRLRLRALDYRGKPVQGKFSIAVSDENQLVFADDKQGHLLSAMLLEQDLKGKIEEPNFYFDTKEPKSLPALDYLMLTQGWRRFVWTEVIENKPIAYPNPKELTEIAGTLMTIDRDQFKPAAGHKIRLMPDGPEQITDANGHFAFKAVDLSRHTALQDSKGGHHDIYEYGSQYIVCEGQWQHFVYAPQYDPNIKGAVLTGVVSDEMDVLIGATVAVMQNKRSLCGAVTNVDGQFVLQLAPGSYDILVSYTGYQSNSIQNVQVNEHALTRLNVKMEGAAALEEVVVTGYATSLIEQDNMSSGQNIRLRNNNGGGEGRRSERKSKKIATSVPIPAPVPLPAGVAPEKEANIKGSRANSTKYYIDGIRITGNAPPVQDLAGKPRIASEDAKKDMHWAERPRFNKARAFYAPQYDEAQPQAPGQDYRTTLYWNPAVQTDSYGYADLEFYASDAITNFRATVEGISEHGQPGRNTTTFFIQKPVEISLKTPPSVITGDTLDLQVGIRNNSAYPLQGSMSVAAPAHFQLLQSPQADAGVAAHGYTLATYRYLIGPAPAKPDQQLQVRFAAPEAFEEVLEANIETFDRGFPIRQVFSGTQAQERFQLSMDTPVEGTARAVLTAYPSTLEDVLKGMERMLRQPSGCFEQVSSSNYPNLLVLQLLKANKQARPELETRAMDLLDDGYKRLIAYECKQGGFDWFGREPAHEGLTAYGLMEFVDMAQVYPVDQALIARTAQWLEARRDGKGGWQLNPNALHGWQSGPALSAYISWACTEAGFGKRFSKEVNTATEKALESKDPYQLALAANTLLKLKDDRAEQVLQQLIPQQTAEGYWDSKGYSAMGSQGKCLQIEITALAALAMLQSGQRGASLQKAINFIIQSKDAYGYGSTQSTVLALKALCAYTQFSNQQPANGTLVVQINGRRVAEQPFASNALKRIEIEGLERYLDRRDNDVEVFFTGGTSIPFDVELKYASRVPRNTSSCPLSLQTRLMKTQAKTGETVRLQAVVQNTQKAVQPSPMLIIGIPAGLSLQPWQLKKLVEEKRCDFYELWNGFAVFYFDRLEPEAQRSIELDLRADIAGAFEAPASQAFLYYQNDQRVWSKPERIVVR